MKTFDAYAHNPYYGVADARRRRRSRRHAEGQARRPRSRSANINVLLDASCAAVRAAPSLDHRVRLPDEPARQGVRRLLGEAGALPDAGVRDRAQEPAHRHDALVPRPRRARPLGLAVGADDRGGQRKPAFARVPSGCRTDAERPSARAAAGRAVDVVDQALDRVARRARAAGRPRPSARAAPGRRASRARRSASASTSPSSTRKPSTPSLTTSGHAADARRDDRAAGWRAPRSRSTGVPSFADGRTSASKAAKNGADVLLVAGEEAVARRCRARARSSSSCSRSGPSPTMQRRASTPRSRRLSKGAQDVSVALDAGHAADPADEEASCGDTEQPPRLAARRARPPRRARSSSIPSRITANFSAGATLSATRSSRTSGLTAIEHASSSGRGTARAPEDRVGSGPK